MVVPNAEGSDVAVGNDDPTRAKRSVCLLEHPTTRIATCDQPPETHDWEVYASPFVHPPASQNWAFRLEYAEHTRCSTDPIWQ